MPAVTTRGGEPTKRPSRKLNQGLIFAGVILLLCLLFGVPLLNQFVLDASNKIELTPKDFVIPALGLLLMYIRGYVAAPHDDEGVQS